MRKVLGLLAISAVLGSPASAGSPVYEVPTEVVVEVAADASAVDWSGGYIGADFGWADVEVSLPGASIGGDGSEYGIFAGYDFDFGSWLLGGTISYATGSLYLDAVDVTADYDLTQVGVRAGYEFGRALAFGELGWSSLSATDADATGYMYGLGIDYQVTDNVVLGIGYQVNQFDDVGPANVELDLSTLRITAGYRF